MEQTAQEGRVSEWVGSTSGCGQWLLSGLIGGRVNVFGRKLTIVFTMAWLCVYNMIIGCSQKFLFYIIIFIVCFLVSCFKEVNRVQRTWLLPG